MPVLRTGRMPVSQCLTMSGSAIVERRGRGAEVRSGNAGNGMRGRGSAPACR